MDGGFRFDTCAGCLVPTVKLFFSEIVPQLLSGRLHSVFAAVGVAVSLAPLDAKSASAALVFLGC